MKTLNLSVEKLEERIAPGGLCGLLDCLIPDHLCVNARADLGCVDARVRICIDFGCDDNGKCCTTK